VDQRGRLQRVIRSFARHALSSNRAQLFVDLAYQLGIVGEARFTIGRWCL
jgi:hypothetical protein